VTRVRLAAVRAALTLVTIAGIASPAAFGDAKPPNSALLDRINALEAEVRRLRTESAADGTRDDAAAKATADAVLRDA